MNKSPSSRQGLQWNESCGDRCRRVVLALVRFGRPGAVFLLCGWLVLAGGVRFESCWGWAAAATLPIGAAPISPELAALAAQRDEGSDDLGRQAATILARRCIECHDPISRAGELDLTRRESALLGGDSGAAIDLGNWEAGQMWLQIESGNMPPVGYPRLTESELATLQHWLQGGAVWPVDAIDPTEFGGDWRLAPNWLKRLTFEQYVRSVRAITGVDIRQSARLRLPADARADGFTNTAYNLRLDLEHVQAYAGLAREVAQQVDLVDLWRRLGIDARDLEQVDTVLQALGQAVYRGGLSAPEVVALRSVYETALGEGGNSAAGWRLVLQSLLQSPRFLFLIEAANESTTAEPVPGDELAVRLSYSLWGAPPDAELWRAAAAGELEQDQRLRAQVQRMLRDPRAQTYSEIFAQDWLDLERLSHLRPNRELFPSFNLELAVDMQRETAAYFQHVVWTQHRPLSDLFTAPIAFLTPRLARHYGVPWDYAAQLAVWRGWSGQGDARAINESNHAGESRAIDSAGFSDRALRWPQALYVFEPGVAQPLQNLGLAGPAADLETLGEVRLDGTEQSWQFAGGFLRTTQPPGLLTARLKQQGALTIEVVLRPESLEQDGPARILTISSGTSQRNVTLGQSQDAYHIRCRTTRTNDNGAPDLQAVAGSAQLTWTHLVYTFQSNGLATLYVNGQEQGTRQVGGDFSNWSEGFHLAIGNETSGDRPWRGWLRRVAIYDQALTPADLAEAAEVLVPHDVSQQLERGGLLTQGSLLTVGGDQASMVARGLFVMEDLLYGKIGNPPPCVDSTPKPSQPGQSQRDMAMVRIEDQACRSCHAKFEPFAFALERYDGLGAYSRQDRFGNDLREDGAVQWPGSDEVLAYKTTRELLAALADSDRLKRGITRKLAQFAIGRPLVPADGPVIDVIHQRGWDNGGTYTSLMTEILVSDLVRLKNP